MRGINAAEQRLREPDLAPGDVKPRCGARVACDDVGTEPLRIVYVNDVGLLAEEVDGNGELLGNFPQAFSHIGLVNAAWAIAKNEAAAGGPPS